MKRFEILPHTGDLAVRAAAPSKQDLVSALIEGMFVAAAPRYLQPAGGATPGVERPFKVGNNDFPALLIDILNEAVFDAMTHHEAYDGVRFSRLTDVSAEGVFLGRAVSGFETEIKAATHHDLAVQKNRDGQWETTVTFDV